MIARKNPSTGKWDAQYSYTDWQGKRKKTTKRGFRTKREAVEWYDHFRATQDADFNMVFKDFIEIYMEDQSHRLRQHTMMNKRFLFDKHKPKTLRNARYELGVVSSKVGRQWMWALPEE